jgi:putative ABC transport system permease protein
LLICVAAAVAAGSGYFTLKLLLDAIYAYHVDVGPVPFVMGALLVLLLALLAISGKVYRAATANPVLALRSE